MESYEFYSIIRAVCEPVREPLNRGKEKPGAPVKKRGKKRGSSRRSGTGDGVRLFVFATGTAEAFISNPQSPSVINHN